MSCNHDDESEEWSLLSLSLSLIQLVMVSYVFEHPESNLQSSSAWNTSPWFSLLFTIITHFLLCCEKRGEEEKKNDSFFPAWDSDTSQSGFLYEMIITWMIVSWDDIFFCVTFIIRRRVNYHLGWFQSAPSWSWILIRDLRAISIDHLLLNYIKGSIIKCFHNIHEYIRLQLYQLPPDHHHRLTSLWESSDDRSLRSYFIEDHLFTDSFIRIMRAIEAKCNQHQVMVHVMAAEHLRENFKSKRLTEKNQESGSHPLSLSRFFKSLIMIQSSLVYNLKLLLLPSLFSLSLSHTLWCIISKYLSHSIIMRDTHWWVGGGDQKTHADMIRNLAIFALFKSNISRIE